MKVFLALIVFLTLNIPVKVSSQAINEDDRKEIRDLIVRIEQHLNRGNTRTATPTKQQGLDLKKKIDDCRSVMNVVNELDRKHDREITHELATLAVVSMRIACSEQTGAIYSSYAQGELDEGQWNNHHRSTLNLLVSMARYQGIIRQKQTRR